jgi:hypothetical protein
MPRYPQRLLIQQVVSISLWFPLPLQLPPPSLSFVQYLLSSFIPFCQVNEFVSSMSYPQTMRKDLKVFTFGIPSPKLINE